MAGTTFFFCEWYGLLSFVFPLCDFFKGLDFTTGFADMVVAIAIVFVF